MGIFGKKKKVIRRSILDQPISIATREYKIFKRHERRKKNWYEVLANISGSLMRISPGKETRDKLNSAIAFTGLRVTPSSVMSMFVLSTLFFTIIGILFAVLGVIPLIGGIALPFVGVLIGYYLIRYPMNLLKTMRIKASSQVVLAILYMVVSMRISPNLEGALKFAASNISGELAWDMRRLIWDIEMRTYASADDALSDYIEKWKPENEEFSEALRLIKESQNQVPERAKAILDESLNVVLDGTKTRMKVYAEELRMPVMIIHMMGIILPVLGTIMAPLAAIFLSNLISPIHFILGYDIILPIIIIWFINNTLRKRPATFSQTDISRYPNLPKEGRFLIKRKSFPALPIAILIAIAFYIPAIMYFIENPGILLGGLEGRAFAFDSFIMSSLLILGTAFAISSYFFLSTFQRTKIKADIQKTEGEFELALFQLGNRIAGGIPTEVAIEDSIKDLKDLKISDLFRLTLRNIRSLGMTFEQALFHKKWGSLRYYPSMLIRNVMYTITDTAKKGVKYASESMMRISKYLKNIRETQEYIREMLSETISSMKFQAYFLTPIITGLIVSMSDIIIQVLSQLSKFLESAGFAADNPLLPNVMGIFGDINTVISPELFQLIVGIYLIEVIFILGMFTTRIGQGEDKTAIRNNVAKMMIVGVVLYFIVALGAKQVFGDLIADALSGLGIL